MRKAVGSGARSASGIPHPASSASHAIRHPPMPHLLAVSLKHSADALPAEFPFTVPAVRALREVAFPSPVTFFVGENGSGKSTLLELIAAAVGLPAVGSEATERDATPAQQR